MAQRSRGRAGSPLHAEGHGAHGVTRPTNRDSKSVAVL